MPKQRYWDSDVFLGWFQNEEDKVDKCHGVVKLAEDGELIIVTSALTMTEVIKLKGKPKLKKDKETIIRKFFEQGFMSIRSLDRTIAEDARQLIWQFNVNPKDSIHLATALKLKLSIFDTFDGDLIKLNNKLGKPPLRIGRPDISYQEEMQLGEKEKQAKKK